ncbi:MAG: topoisomerase DNA-binding C4 zinc finger domain-containing protein [Ramlibacter sp.]
MELLQIAYEGEYWRPTCANCGTKMVEREARNTASRFWGCAQYPRCKSMLPMRQPA